MKWRLSSIAGWIGVISALGAVVIVWGRDCCTDGRGADGRGTDAYPPATARVGSAIDAATIDAGTMHAADANTTSADTASEREGISRNTRDAKDGSGSNGNNGSIRHGISLLGLGSGRQESRMPK